MAARRGTYKWGAAILLAAGLAAVAAIVVLARPLSFIHLRHNLSQTAYRVSARPDLTTSSNGDWVAAVWTEGYAEDKGFRGHVYLHVASETDSGWGNKYLIFEGSSSAYAYDAAMAITGTTAHVAYVVFQFDGITLDQVQVRYKTCSLTNGQCSGEETMYTETDKAYLITQVDITLGDGGDPHVAWARYVRADESKGDIYHQVREGGGWSEKWWVDAVPNRRDSAPAIAWDSGYTHVVWEADGNSIRYRRRQDTGTWDSVDTMSPGSLFPPGNPDVAAGSGRVFVVWDWCFYYINGKCEEYYLVYSHSDVTGTLNLDDYYEVGTNKTGSDLEMLYYSTPDVDSLPDKDEYLLDLQPAIALNDAGWPSVVWHADRSGGDLTDYAIYYSYALTGTVTVTDTSVNWVITPTVLSLGTGTMLGSATIDMGKSESDGEYHLHVAYMEKKSATAWDVYYNSNEWERYPHVFLPVLMKNN